MPSSLRPVSVLPWHAAAVLGGLVALATSRGMAQPAAPMPASAPTLLGDLGGLRPFLAQWGITVALNEQSDAFGNLGGGRSQAADYEGLTTGAVRIDTSAIGLPGGMIYASALQYHGRNLTTDSLLALQAATDIESRRGERLFEWYDDQTLDHGLDVRIGLQSLDQEFIINAASAVFLNSTFGWPLLAAEDLPGTAPAYPLSAPGVRLRLQAGGGVTVLAGLFNGTPLPHGCSGDALRCNASGTSFPLDGGALIIDEVQVRRRIAGLAGTYKLGVWIDTERFADERLDRAGGAAASAAVSPPRHGEHDDWSVYATADQLVWNPGGTRALTAFARAMAAPADRNLISLYANAGLAFTAPLRGRPNDSAGIAFGYGRVSDQAAGFDSPPLSRRCETIAELTYTYAVTDWWEVQPDIQYIFNPGGGIADPDDPARRLGDEWLVG